MTIRDLAVGERPRLLYVATDAVTADILLSGQLAWFDREGFDVAVAAAPGPSLDRVSSREGVRVFPIPFQREISPLRDLFALRRLNACLRSFRPHIVNAGTPKAGLLGLLSARWAGSPSRIYLLRGLRLQTTRGPKRLILRTAERLAARSATCIVSVSPSLRDAAVAEELASTSKIHVLGCGSSNGVDCDRFAPSPRLDAAAMMLRANWGIPAKARVIGFIGRLTRDKGIADLVEAFLAAAGELPDVYLVLIGREEAGDPVGVRTLKMLRNHPRVRFAGSMKDVAPCYRAIDVLAFPSYREGLPNVPLEAAASERPVVAYAATGTVDAVRHGATGFVCAIGDRQALADGLRQYLTDASLRAAHGAAGRQFVHANFSQQEVWRKWRTLYERELRRIGGPLPVSDEDIASRGRAA